MISFLLKLIFLSLLLIITVYLILILTKKVYLADTVEVDEVEISEKNSKNFNKSNFKGKRKFNRDDFRKKNIFSEWKQYDIRPLTYNEEMEEALITLCTDKNVVGAYLHELREEEDEIPREYSSDSFEENGTYIPLDN